jgi:hypothetical protein
MPARSDQAMSRRHQPTSAVLTAAVLLAGPLVRGGYGAGPPALVTAPPARLKLDPFYKKYVSADGLPVVASGKVPGPALLEARELVRHMLRNRPDVRDALIRAAVRVAVMARAEVTTDVPEHRDLRPRGYWDRRARGVGATTRRPAVSCAEENLLGYKDDRYRGESILIHEFAHTIHEMGLAAVDPTFDARLRKLYGRAMRKGLWRKTYAATNHKEYWAEGVQSFFHANLTADPPNGVHNHVGTREQLAKYDPDLAKLIAEVFRNDPWRWRPAGAHRKPAAPAGRTRPAAPARE